MEVRLVVIKSAYFRRKPIYPLSFFASTPFKSRYVLTILAEELSLKTKLSLKIQSEKVTKKYHKIAINLVVTGEDRIMICF